MRDGILERQPEMDDAALIAGYLAGDESRFAMLYERYKRQLYRYLNDLATDRGGEVDDVFQRTWLKAIDSLARYQDKGCFLAWLFRIARNEFLDRVRSDRRRPVVSMSAGDDDGPAFDSPAPAGTEPWRALDESEIRAVMEKVLGELPPEQREVFLLRRDEMSFKEIAGIQGCSINTVLGRMQYALKNLRRALGRIDDGGLIQ